MTKGSRILSTILFGATVALGGAAHAAFRHYPASLCVGTQGHQAMVLTSNGQATNTSTTDFAVWLCPIQTDSNTSITSSSTVRTFGFANAAGSLIVTSCRQSSSGGSIVCDSIGSSQDETAAGTVNLNWHPGTAWTSAGTHDSLFIEMMVDAVQSGSFTTVFGYGLDL